MLIFCLDQYDALAMHKGHAKLGLPCQSAFTREFLFLVDGGGNDLSVDRKKLNCDVLVMVSPGCGVLDAQCGCDCDGRRSRNGSRETGCDLSNPEQPGMVEARGNSAPRVPNLQVTGQFSLVLVPQPAARARRATAVVELWERARTLN
jgi:hypothetical protein